MTKTEEELLKIEKLISTVSGARIVDCLVAMDGIADPVQKMAELEAEANRMHDHAAALAAEASKTALEIKDALKIRGELEKLQNDMVVDIERLVEAGGRQVLSEIGGRIDQILA